MRVAINGIGVAGPTLAYWLRRYGHEPVMFEKAPALRTGGHVIDFWGLGYAIAERMGLIPVLRQRGYMMKRLRMVDGHGHDDANLDLTMMRELLGGRFISLARADLSSGLFSACEGIPAHFGTTITGLVRGRNAVMLTFDNGRRDEFDFVVGADGLHSQVRQLTFGPQAKFEKPLDCYVAAFRISGYPRRDELTYVSHTVPGRQVGRVSLRGDETLILLICRASLIGSEPPALERQKEALRWAFSNMDWEVPDILDAMDGVEDIYFDRVSQIHLPCWSSGRVALIGDAAACASLLAGEGAGLAMIEAYVLAGEIHRANGNFQRAFASYEARLRRFVTAKQQSALRFRSFFAPRSALALGIRNFSVNCLSHPFFARRFVTRSIQDTFELPSYLRS
ncbi:MAG TPA: FAD-binding domain [Steroidobacteraceae bacterium]|nr:FAD-binding domain [Steroidobacteraceae bacterium]